MPCAELLYACDASWWHFHRGARAFKGERWSTHESTRRNNKAEVAKLFGVRLVEGGEGEGFSSNPDLIHYGGNSGFQAVGLALLMGARRVALAGFDMHGAHFFGKHPAGLRNTGSFSGFIKCFERAALALPANLSIVNCTPGSALRCFPFGSLEDEIRKAGCIGIDR